MLDLESYRTFLLRKGLKLSTISLYLRCLKQYEQESLQSVSLDKYLANLCEKGKHTRLRNTISALRDYGQFANDPDLAKTDYFPCPKSHPKATMSNEEITAFLNLPCPPRFPPERYRMWTLFFKIIAFTGARPGEIAVLRIDDVDFGRGVFSLPDTKTNEPRLVPIPPNISPEIKEYIGKLRGKYLFPAKLQKNNKFMCKADWQKCFKHRIERLGIKRSHLSCYSLRHSFITEMLQTEGVNVFQVQKIVGHHNLSTTQNYYHLTNRDICNTIKKHALIRKGTDPKDILNNLISMIRSFEIDKDKRFTQIITESGNKLLVEIDIV